ncbi:globin-like protein [Polychytrium aggregatum]|uniref:globin-like protein n=1 Tax=Polychytrium aggregatum TaxID=110093 RepID=UPI0022FDD9DC|nr:globin-like protein [Polychytrium aggregatum]KAI9202567.1 globin-like protein [Polychytrium aggregatum]
MSSRNHKRPVYVYPTAEECALIKQSWDYILSPPVSESGADTSTINLTIAPTEHSALSDHSQNHVVSTTGFVTTQSAAFTGTQQYPNSPATQFTIAFYTNLFHTNPEYRFLFTDVFRQSSALSGMLSRIVRNVDRISEGADAMRRLGYRHAAVYKIRDEMYETVGRNMVCTVRETLMKQGRWSPEIDWAWLTVWTLLSTWMKEGAHMNPDESELDQKEKCSVM